MFPLRDDEVLCCTSVLHCGDQRPSSGRGQRTIKIERPICCRDATCGNKQVGGADHLRQYHNLRLQSIAPLRSLSLSWAGKKMGRDVNANLQNDFPISGENAQTCGPGFLYAFDLIEINGDDLRREPLEVRTATLASVLAKAAPGLRLNEHIEADGPTVFAHACKMGLEVVSKRKASSYRSGRSPDLAQVEGKMPQQGLFLSQGHVLALATAAWLASQRLEPAVVIGHVGAVRRGAPQVVH